MDGIGQARDFGTFLSGRVSPAGVRIFAGNTLRAIQTAETIRGALEDGSGTRARDIGLVPELGDDSPFFRERDERMALIAGGRYLERLNDYFRTGFQQGYRPLAAATDAMEHVLERLAGRHKEVVVAITHDINVAAFLAGRGVVAAFDEETWPHYGDAAVIIRNDEGKIEYGYYRRDYTPDDDDL
jgi:broad specificity phosphatase PhoE